MVIIWEGTLNTITTVLSNNFESHSSGTLICRCPRGIMFDLVQLTLLWSFDGWNVPSESCPTRCSYFVIILNFCIDRPCGFQPIRIIIFHFFFVSNFCLDRPFGFSVHRDAIFCLSRLLRFATYRAFHINKVFLDCIGIHRTYKFVTIFCN